MRCRHWFQIRPSRPCSRQRAKRHRRPHPPAWEHRSRMRTRAPLLLILAALVVALLLFWVLTGDTNEGPTTPSTPASSLQATAASAEPEPPPRSPAKTKSGYRLAGTVVGDALYAVIEQPDGTNDLYRPGQTVPGLGRLIDLEADRATFDGDEGRIELQLVPAPTPTDTPSPAEDRTLAPTTPPAEPSALDLTPPATSPSSATDLSAS